MPGNILFDVVFKITAFCLLAVFFSLSHSPEILADDTISTVEQINRNYTGNLGKYSVVVHAVASLSNLTQDGFKVSELSGLAWDKDEQILYALSDNGYILHLRPRFRDGNLENITLVSGYSLHDEKGKILKYRNSDSEGIAIRNSDNNIKGDTELYVCFERIPRIIRYSMTGTYLGAEQLPEHLAKIENYSSENKSLESIAIHPEFGIIVGTERPLNNETGDLLYLYSLSGHKWNIPVQNAYYGGLVDLALMDDNSILVLERSYGGLIPTMEISLHRLVPENNEAELLIAFKPADDIFNENYEGIARYEGNRYFMVSDDNNHPLNKTLLLYISINRNERLN